MNLGYSDMDKYLDVDKSNFQMVQSGSGFQMITDEALEFSLKNPKKSINVKAIFSKKKIILTDGYFRRNEVHRFREVCKKMEDVNKSYYEKRKQLLLNGSLIEETVLNNELLKKYINDNSSYTRFRIIKPIEFESIVFATSMIYGDWQTKEQCLKSWKRNDLLLKNYVR